jgi:uncharacterized protein YciI
MFVVALHYTDLAGVDAQLEAHRAFLREQYAAGVFLMSGPQVPRTGGLIVAHAPSRAALDAILDRDPFRQAGVATYAITEFTPTMTAAALAAWRVA